MSRVKADLAELRKQLLASGKTIGFVARESEAITQLAQLFWHLARGEDGQVLEEVLALRAFKGLLML